MLIDELRNSRLEFLTGIRNKAPNEFNAARHDDAIALAIASFRSGRAMQPDHGRTLLQKLAPDLVDIEVLKATTLVNSDYTLQQFRSKAGVAYSLICLRADFLSDEEKGVFQDFLRAEIYCRFL